MKAYKSETFAKGGTRVKITKKNGNVTMYDDEKVVRSILRANAEVREEPLSEKEAAAIANRVFAKLTAEYEVITTADIRDCVGAILVEKGLPQTAEKYLTYQK